ncbi:MAG: N-acetylmuramoyl-L-alanine amidase [Elusimicrobia bacterium]|nr:N-acetylmuramoyl-L-alanine amidase [Elusimicrobiota bacterium]
MLGTSRAAIFCLILAGAASPGEAAPKKKAPAKAKAAKLAPLAVAAPAEDVALSSVPISLVYPPEGMSAAAIPGELVYGAVNRPGARFTINGYPVKLHAKGGYLTYLPVVPGTFTFRCELAQPGSAPATLERTIFVAAPPAPVPGPAIIETASILPAEDAELRPGDWLIAQMRATPGVAAEFQVSGQRKKWPMAPIDPVLGVYRGAFQIQPTDSWEPAPIEFHLRSAEGKKFQAESRGRVAVRAPLLNVATVTGANVYVKTGPGEGYQITPPRGTPFVTTGRQGPDTRVWLSPSLSGWVPTAALSPAPAGTPPPQASLGTVRTTASGDSTFVHLGVGQIVPFSVDVDPDLGRLRVRLYYANGHTNWIIYDSSDAFVDQVTWRQVESGVVEALVKLSPKRRLWGYRADWEGGNLKLELRHPPKVAAAALSGRTIVVDAGHMPSAPGAVGPRGTQEMEANLGIARELEAQLKLAGAKVVMTRSGADEVALLERAKLAWEARGDVFVSVHNNTLPSGANPFRSAHGFSIFYHHPMSLDLARKVHRAYRRDVPLPDEGLRYGDLLVARITEMPSILTESAYVTFPDQEDLLATPSFRKKVAGAIVKGLKDFLDAERARQKQ